MLIGRVQDIFISLLSPYIPWVVRIPVRLKYALITACFLADILLFFIVRFILGSDSYFVNTMLGVTVMLVIAVLSLDRGLKRIHWRRSVWISWFGLCTVITISDIIVPKKICGLGIVLGLMFTLVFFVWQNHTRRDLLMDCFKNAVRISFVVMSIVAFLFRPMYEGVRYSGIFTNPNTFGLYLVVIFAVYMADLDFRVVTGASFIKSINTYISIALIVFYLLMTQSRTAMVSCVCVFIMWVVFRTEYSIRTHMWRSLIKGVCLLAVISVIAYPIFRIAGTQLYRVFGAPIVYEHEDLFLTDGLMIEDFGEIMIAEPDADAQSLIDGYIPDGVIITDDGVALPDGNFGHTGTDSDAPEKPIVPQNVVERFWYVLEHTGGINALLSGRLGIFKGYYKQLNYIGHPYISLVVNGSFRAHAHNNWLQYAYTYGYFGGFFYLLLSVLGVALSIKFYIKRSRMSASYAFLIPAICIGFPIATLAECMILPFEVFPAFAYWFCFGELFIKKVPKNRMLAAIEGE